MKYKTKQTKQTNLLSYRKWLEALALGAGSAARDVDMSEQECYKHTVVKA
jgi:hypothetical protein